MGCDRYPETNPAFVLSEFEELLVTDFYRKLVMHIRRTTMGYRPKKTQRTNQFDRKER